MYHGCSFNQNWSLWIFLPELDIMDLILTKNVATGPKLLLLPAKRFIHLNRLKKVANHLVKFGLLGGFIIILLTDESKCIVFFLKSAVFVCFAS